MRKVEKEQPKTKGGKEGKTLSDVIGCRDDIMSNLMTFGLESSDAFNIMEKVRKGKGLSEEHEAAMKAHGVKQFYIDCIIFIKRNYNN